MASCGLRRCRSPPECKATWLQAACSRLYRRDILICKVLDTWTNRQIHTSILVLAACKSYCLSCMVPQLECRSPIGLQAHPAAGSLQEALKVSRHATRHAHARHEGTAHYSCTPLSLMDSNADLTCNQALPLLRHITPPRRPLTKVGGATSM